MKVLNPTVSIIMPSHMKPEYLPDALDSIVEQTRLDIQVIVVDSGEWISRTDERSLAMREIHEVYSAHPLIEWYSLGEIPSLITRRCPYAYIINEVFRKELARGKYISFATDDDIFTYDFIDKMAGHLDANPHDMAVYCAQDRVTLSTDGTRIVEPGIPANEPRTAFDQQVDLLQVMLRASILPMLSADQTWLPEDSEDSICRHADGIFLDKIGALAPVPNIPEPLVTHRFTPISTYN